MFDEIELRCPMNIELRTSKTTKTGFIVISAQENLMPHITTEVKDGKLIIDTENCINTLEDWSAQIAVADLKGVYNKASGNIRSQGGLPFVEMEVINSGSGEIDLRIKGGPVEVQNSGSGLIFLEGVSSTLDVELTGSGDVELSNLMAQDVTIESNGSGNASLWTENTIEIILKGSGNVTYVGRPVSVSEENKGSGEIVRGDK